MASAARQKPDAVDWIRPLIEPRRRRNEARPVATGMPSSKAGTRPATWFHGNWYQWWGDDRFGGSGVGMNAFLPGSILQPHWSNSREILQ